MGVRTTTVTGLLAALLPVLAVPAVGQTLDGRVADELTRTPLAGATVILLDTAGNEFMRIETDHEGRFVLPIPAAGRYRLWSDGPGYAQILSPMFDVGPERLPVTILLRPLPVTLDEVRVTAEARRLALERTGFYQRRDLGIGRFVDVETIEARSPLETTDILRAEASVRLMSDAGGDGGVGTAMVFRGAVRGLQEGSGRPCLPTLVLDGVKVRASGPLPPPEDITGSRRPIRINELVHPTEILAIELYPNGAGAPPQWTGMDAYCGVVVIWTKQRRP